MVKEFWHLGVEDFFTGLEPERRAFLARARRRELPRFSTVFEQDEPARSCFYLEKGLVRIHGVSPQGKEPIFFLRREGEIFGLAEVLEAQPRRAAAQTLTPAALHEMDRRDLEAFLDENPRAARRVITILGRRLRHLGDQVGGLILSGVEERLARLLAGLCAEAFSGPSPPPGPVDVPVRLTQENLAAMAGSCQQTICQCLGKFQAEGLIRVERRRISILDPSGLLARAGG